MYYKARFIRRYLPKLPESSMCHAYLKKGTA